ncbi:alpha-(1,3)-fucosyltransferase 10 [Xenopus tropicalis]|uniref:GDP-fucose protein O-fucosyltransferase 3 n=1 Tax=Xenopus tropicalis TaxID=8364 RepID=OFUT3_XENTR|nr:alpha-(1,3)-fucosyltransferase 10 [Xenopus tropicalis]Q6A1G3.1 RecName: Full=Alpha-(1,3)-fucosyltransferase 10; AltName: Full=Fucosyltransferase X; Short=Fuc-TX; Short=FucT-X; AltName: Full=Galactoside 3-L-fucosyltransferase 10; Short=Fucosyltransferase 10 [Xenopus tropicalis]CAH04944.1 alpha3-fucosyltransferase [Xenopus tropicalis]|eukprot:NP_001002903.1 alpha-(1,3)-fucosyltransferase 10 [Xenopus tropicalis]
MNRMWEKKFWISCFFIILFFILVTLQVMVELGRFEKRETKSFTVIDIKEQKKPLLKHIKEKSNSRLRHLKDNYPIMLWWSPLTGENGRLGQCGTDTCFFTINRTYLQDPMTKAILFYGTDFNMTSLPLPREISHEWALFHEESPKNNYKLFHEPAITLFNHTATFSRHSHLPLTSQYLEGLQALRSKEYLISIQKKNFLRKRLAPLAYVQSDCDPPSDRDSYVQELMKYIAVDSYGECLHNRDLPQQVNNPSSMDDSQFHHILAQYKFILAFENAVCEDYITEKLWRPLKLGAVPVYFGAPNVENWLPSNKSAIIVGRFSHPKELATYIKKLDKNDKLYMQFIEWKLHGNINNKHLLSTITERKWGVQDVTQDNYIDAFECMICKRVWENVRLKDRVSTTKLWNAESLHLNCPAPEAFSFLPGHLLKSSMREMWKPSFEQSKKEAKALRTLVDRNRNFTTVEFWNLVFKFQ